MEIKRYLLSYNMRKGKDLFSDLKYFPSLARPVPILVIITQYWGRTKHHLIS